MQESNRVIQSAWIGSHIGMMERLCINSFLKNGHEFHLYTYGDVGPLPFGTEQRSITDVLPLDLINPEVFKDKYAVLSDIFRYHLIKTLGGWWVDLDTYCLRPFDFDSDYVFDADRMKVKSLSGPLYESGEVPIRTQSGDFIYIINGTYKAPKNSPLMEEMASRSLRCFDWKDTGPSSFTGTIVSKFPDLLKYVLPLPLLNPLSWWNLSRLWDDNQPQTLPEGAYAIHLYRSNWIAANADMETDRGMYGLLRKGKESDISYVSANSWFDEEWKKLRPQAPQRRLRIIRA